VAWVGQFKKSPIYIRTSWYNVFLFDEPLKGSKPLKIFKVSLTFRFDKLWHLSKSVHTGENSQILTVSSKQIHLEHIKTTKDIQGNIHRFSQVSQHGGSTIVRLGIKYKGTVTWSARKTNFYGRVHSTENRGDLSEICLHVHAVQLYLWFCFIRIPNSPKTSNLSSRDNWR
jgi:hypothetical protein